MSKISRKFGFDLLFEQVIDHIVGEMEWQRQDWAFGDTEIEKLFSLALAFYMHHGGSEYVHLLRPKSLEAAEKSMLDCPDPDLTLFCIPQVPIDRYRVDFLVAALDVHKSTPDKRVWRRLVVECDGHDFHERTKEQAAKDRSRDRYLSMKGFDIFRFTGSELWKDPWDCAEQVLNWALKEWY